MGITPKTKPKLRETEKAARRSFNYTTCGATGRYDPKTGTGVVHKPGCVLAPKEDAS